VCQDHTLNISEGKNKAPETPRNVTISFRSEKLRKPSDYRLYFMNNAPFIHTSQYK